VCQLSRYTRKDDKPSGNLSTVRRQFDALFDETDSVHVHPAPISSASTFVAMAREAMGAGPTPLLLRVGDIATEEHGEIVALRLDSLNGGRALTLLIDKKFWRFTLSLMTYARLRLEDGRVFLRYAGVGVDQWLGHLVTGRRMDWHSVRSKAGESVIDYRLASLEVRQDTDQKAEDERLKSVVDFQTENPEYPMLIGGKRVYVGGTAQQTAGNGKPKGQKVVGIFKYRDSPKTTRFGRSVTAGHERRQGVNAGEYDQMNELTAALMKVPTLGSGREGIISQSFVGF
jgi:hypothetical protein